MTTARVQLSRPSSPYAVSRMRQILLLSLALAARAVYSAPPRVYILDVPQLPGLPPCSYDDSAVWDSGINVVTDSRQDGHSIVPHQHLQYAGPWYFHKALAASPLVEHDSRAADLVYVHWHCYYLRFWSLLYRDKKPAEAATFMKTALQAVKASDLWQVHNGTNFVFYFQCPALNWLLDDCDIPSFLILHEASPKCRFSGQGPPLPAQRSVIAPYSTTTGVTGNIVAMQERDVLLFFSGACTHEPDDGNDRVGKKMRRIIVNLIKTQFRALNISAHTLHVHCACHSCSTRLSHESQMAMMRRTRFCLVLPGDTQSSRRITEVVLAGCIPVLIMPPMHTLPLAAFVDYQKFAVVVRVPDASPWMAPGSYEDAFWTNDTSLDTTVNITSLSGLLPHLLGLAQNGNVLQQMQQHLLRYRSFFLYTGAFHAPGADQGPEDAVIKAISSM